MKARAKGGPGHKPKPTGGNPRTAGEAHFCDLQSQVCMLKLIKIAWALLVLTGELSCGPA